MNKAGGCSRGVLFFIFCMALAVLSGCSAGGIAPSGQGSFEDYRRDNMAWIEVHREYQTDDKARETLWNAPTEWRPKGKPQKGILLIHGLGDSPWSFVDVAPSLAEQGFLVRALLLPGNGTRPSDMLRVSVDDWRRVLREQAAIMRAEVEDLYLGGFSAGCNLVMEYAVQNPDVKGLVLFSPAFQSRLRLGVLAEVVGPFADLLFFPSSGAEQQPTRYVSLPAKGFAMLYETSQSVHALLKENSYDKPVFVVLAQHDMSVDTGYVLDMFERSFSHSQSRLVWYGEAPPAASGRIITKSEYVPEWRVGCFTHMASLFSPHNSEYGVHGAQRLCVMGQSAENYQKCRDGAEVWYAEMGYDKDDQPYARLTFNPYLDWQNQQMLKVLTDDAIVNR